MKKERFFTPRQVWIKGFIPLGLKTIYRLVNEGKIRSIRISGGDKQARFKISEKEIKRFLTRPKS